MGNLKEVATTWNNITKTITGTVAACVAVAASVAWFQPAQRAEAQHTTIVEGAETALVALSDAIDDQFETVASDQSRQLLEAELERIELALKLFSNIRERRELTHDERDELEYLKARRLQIRRRLFDE